jgi:hypothetical protein
MYHGIKKWNFIISSYFTSTKWIPERLKGLTKYSHANPHHLSSDSSSFMFDIVIKYWLLNYCFLVNIAESHNSWQGKGETQLMQEKDYN